MKIARIGERKAGKHEGRGIPFKEEDKLIPLLRENLSEGASRECTGQGAGNVPERVKITQHRLSTIYQNLRFAPRNPHFHVDNVFMEG
jgi:hypothetical protein